ncbi:MAG TPA: hypothetical protein VL403_04730 [Candidatus Kryptonia bacterium]|nr:hypothetical protein [Candidatus Kryptonia bacterium]
MNFAVAALSLVAVAAAIVAWRARLRLRRAVLVHELVHAAATIPSPLPVSPRPLLDHPDEAAGWIFTTGDGTCALISEGARALLGVDRSLPPERARLHALLRDGELLVPGMMRELRERSLLPTRSAVAAAGPSRPVELAGVALRDRAGGLWGTALFIRPLPSAGSRP